jgi:hypothetical protein
LATAVKITLAVPFLGLLALHRRFGAIAASLATWAGLNALGFLRMGAGSLNDYRENVAQLEAIDNINSPDPWRPIALPRLDWSYLFYGLTKNLAASRLAGLVASGVLGLWLLREGIRHRQHENLTSTTLFLLPLVCLGSLCVYHHQYDACLFFAPAILIFLLWGRRRGPIWCYGLMGPLLLMILLLPIGKMQSLFESMWGLTGVGVTKLAFPVAVVLTLAGSLLILRMRSPEPVEIGQAAE